LQNDINPNRIITQIGVGPIWFGEKLPLLINDSIFYITDERAIFYKKFVSFSGQKLLYGPPLKNIDTPVIIVDHDIVATSGKGGRPYFVSTISGAVELDTLTYKPINRFLPGKVVTRAIVDKEGDYWFSTLGDGVFKLANKEVLTFKPYAQEEYLNEVFSIASAGKKIYTGNFKSKMIEWDMKSGYKPISFSSFLPMADNKLATNRLNAIFSLPNGKFLLGFDAFLIKWSGKVNNVLPVTAIKSIASDDHEHALIATGLGVIRVNLNSFKAKDTIWQTRSTSAVRLGNTYYVGTLNGLIEVDVNTRKSKGVTQHPSLVRRITDLKTSDNSLWVATSDSGIVQLTNGKVVRTFSESNGLNSNICRVIYPYEKSLWIGTNKGICKLDLLNPLAFPVKYDSYNLLPSDMINAIFIKNGTIYVGSPAGLTYFQEEKLPSFSICKLYIQSIRTESGIFSDRDTFHLGNSANQFEVYFSAISIKSSGEVTFYYRMTGLDNHWRNTKSELITYSSIPSGDYQFEIYAVNKFGVKSETRKINIFVPLPYWKEPVFWIIVSLIIVGLSVWTFKFKEKQIRNKLDAQNQVEKQLASLEQKAIQAQMNPHFIFNSLNSIQQYILTNNVEDANRYLSIFAALIRETLENSSSGKISLNREIGYITKYLELERMRFGNTFDFIIDANGLELDTKIEFPVMLIQPYVENAVRHGMRYTTEGKGMIQIDFWRENNHIFCRIKDNGPGRAESFRIKSKQHIEYQSQGMNLTQRRVDILNTIFEEKILIEVKDIINEKGGVAGTEVQLTLTQITNETDD
jgi:two-component sensor histidine kinase